MLFVVTGITTPIDKIHKGRMFTLISHATVVRVYFLFSRYPSFGVMNCCEYFRIVMQILFFPDRSVEFVSRLG